MTAVVFAVPDSPSMLVEDPDSVQWVGDTLELEDGPDTWRWERNSQEATEIRIFKNGVPVIDLDLQWDGSNVSTIRGQLSGSDDWLEMDANTGEIVGTNYGTGEECDPEVIDPLCEPVPEFNDSCNVCGHHWDAAMDHASDAIGYAGLAIIAILTPWKRAAGGLVRQAARSVIDSAESFGAWLACEFTKCWDVQHASVHTRGSQDGQGQDA